VFGVRAKLASDDGMENFLSCNSFAAAVVGGTIRMVSKQRLKFRFAHNAPSLHLPKEGHGIELAQIEFSLSTMLLVVLPMGCSGQCVQRILLGLKVLIAICHIVEVVSPAIHQLRWKRLIKRGQWHFTRNREPCSRMSTSIHGILVRM